jgi:hypothetical protein
MPDDEGVQIWRTVILGQLPSLDSYRWFFKKLEVAAPTQWAQEMMERVVISKEQIKLDLYAVTGRDLNCVDKVWMSKIQRLSAGQGYTPVPAETALAVLRDGVGLQYNRRYILGMEMIYIRGEAAVFSVAYDLRGRFLDVAPLTRKYGPEDTFVFARAGR